jgi:hypothetical protein
MSHLSLRLAGGAVGFGVEVAAAASAVDCDDAVVVLRIQLIQPRRPRWTQQRELDERETTATNVYRLTGGGRSFLLLVVGRCDSGYWSRPTGSYVSEPMSGALTGTRPRSGDPTVAELRARTFHTDETPASSSELRVLFSLADVRAVKVFG